MNLAQKLLANDQQTVQENKNLSLVTPVNNGVELSEEQNTTEEVEPVSVISDDEEKPEAKPVTTATTEEPEKPQQTAQVLSNTDQPVSQPVLAELSPIEKRRNQLYAEIQVQLMSLVMCAIFQWITGEWGEENEKKYTPSSKKQKDLATTIAEYNNLELVKKDPKTNVWGMMIAIYAPITLMAVQTAMRNKSNKKKGIKPQLTVVKTKEVKKSTETPVEDVKTPTETPVPTTTSLARKLAYTAVDGKNTATVKKQKNKEFLDQTIKTETRGRKKGSKKNPSTGKMEYPVIKDGFKVYSWGLKIKD